MQTAELIKQLYHVSQTNTDTLSTLNWNDIKQCVLLELSLRSGLYSAEHEKEITNILSHLLIDCEISSRSHDTTKLGICLAELNGMISMLPDIEHYDSIQANARFEHAALDHYRNDTTIIVGDSHVNFFSGNETLNYYPISQGINICPNVNETSPFTVLYMGPALAYNCCKPDSSSGFYENMLYLTKHFIHPGARIIVSLGEIDLRVHVFKEAPKQKRSYHEIIDSIIDNYMAFLKFLHSEGYKLFCWGPIASQKDDSPQNPAFPRLGTETERNKATEYFSERLSGLCAAEDISFLSIFYKMITDDYHTCAEYLSSDHFHLSQRAMTLAEPILRSSGLII